MKRRTFLAVLMVLLSCCSGFPQDDSVKARPRSKPGLDPVSSEVFYEKKDVLGQEMTIGVASVRKWKGPFLDIVGLHGSSMWKFTRSDISGFTTALMRARSGKTARAGKAMVVLWSAEFKGTQISVETGAEIKDKGVLISIEEGSQKPATYFLRHSEINQVVSQLRKAESKSGWELYP